MTTRTSELGTATRSTITVTDLVDTFRTALLSLVPFAERLRIPWRDGESYDDWDAVAEVLWRSFVVDAIAAALRSTTELEMPRYGFAYDSFPFANLLVVLPEDSELSVVQQVVMDGAPEARLKIARVRACDRVRMGESTIPLTAAPLSLMRPALNGADRHLIEIPLDGSEG